MILQEDERITTILMSSHHNLASLHDACCTVRNEAQTERAFLGNHEGVAYLATNAEQEVACHAREPCTTF